MSASNPTDSPPQCEPALRAIAMPADANPAGDIFGGWLLSQMASPAARSRPAEPGDVSSRWRSPQ